MTEGRQYINAKIMYILISISFSERRQQRRKMQTLRELPSTQIIKHKFRIIEIKTKQILTIANVITRSPTVTRGDVIQNTNSSKPTNLS